jgi:hypothetical protein
MGAAICTVAAKTYDDTLMGLNMTTMTGGSGATIGYTKSDWLYINSVAGFTDLEASRRKIEGGRQIIPELFHSGADPDPTAANGGNLAINNFTADVGDRTTGTFSTNSGLQVTASSSRINCGIKFVFTLTRETQTFWWLGHSRNGGWEASVTFSDATTSTPYALPYGASNVHVPAWFEAQFRGTWDQVDAGVTATVAITRVNTGISASGAVYNRALVLLQPTPAPRPHGMFLGRKKR